MRDFLYRLTVLFTNLFFPPIAVAMLTGINMDVVINCCLLLLAIIPSHIHGFYVTCTYFHRRSKVKRGQYPGGAKPFIYSQSVANGGFSDAVVDALYRKERGLSRRRSRRAGDEDLRRQPSTRQRELQRYYSRDDYGANRVSSHRGSYMSNASTAVGSRSSGYDMYHKY